jgi:hypothetical protein
MAHAKNRADWNQTSHLIALLININRAKGKRAVSAKEFNPYAEKRTNSGKPDFYITPAQLAQTLTKSAEESE